MTHFIVTPARHILESILSSCNNPSNTALQMADIDDCLGEDILGKFSLCPYPFLVNGIHIF